MTPRRLVVGITGASGARYAAQLLDALAEAARDGVVKADVVLSRTGSLVFHQEVGRDPAEWGFPVHGRRDFMAPFASGSAQYDGMVVIPCSAGHVGRIATGVSTDLVSRAAAVMLKERRTLVLVVREAPYDLILLRNMVALAEAGALILPASPSFYSAPRDIGELVDTVNARVLDQLGVPHERSRRWAGRAPPRPDPGAPS